MFRIGPLFILLIAGVIVGVIAMRRRAHPTPGVATPVHEEPPGVFDRDLDRWAAAGLISPEQASAIAHFELGAPTATARAAPRPVRRVPLVAEALGYLGGMLGIIGVGVWVSTFWRDISGGVRLAVSGAIAALLVAIGFGVKAEADEALARLRGFVWFAGSAVAGVVGGVIVHDFLHTMSRPATIEGAAVGVLVVSAVLWRGCLLPAQQLTTLAALLTAVGVGGWQVGHAVAASVAEVVVAASVLALGLQRRTPTPWLATVVGTVGFLVGSALIIQRWNERGAIALLVASLVVLILAELPALKITGAERIAMLIVGTIALSNGGASALAYFARHAGIVTGLGVWAAGGVAAVAAISHRVVHRILVEVAGGLVVIGGAALTGVQHQGFATLFGLVTALAMLAIGSQPGRVLMSVTGSLCLLVNVPWAISHFFPSENLAPLLIAVSGVLLVAVAVVLTRMGGRFRTELHH